MLHCFSWFVCLNRFCCADRSSILFSVCIIALIRRRRKQESVGVSLRLCQKRAQFLLVCFHLFPERFNFYLDGPVSMFPAYKYLHQCVPTCILVAHIFIPMRRCLVVPIKREILFNALCHLCKQLLLVRGSSCVSSKSTFQLCATVSMFPARARFSQCVAARVFQQANFFPVRDSQRAPSTRTILLACGSSCVPSKRTFYQCATVSMFPARAGFYQCAAARVFPARVFCPPGEKEIFMPRKLVS